MAQLTVTEVIDGDTFRVTPRCVFRGEKYDVIRPTGYNTPERGKPGYDAATTKLRHLILNKAVELGNVVNIDRGRLVCKVTYDGKDLADYFPEYKV